MLEDLYYTKYTIADSVSPHLTFDGALWPGRSQAMFTSLLVVGTILCKSLFAKETVHTATWHIILFPNENGLPAIISSTSDQFMLIPQGVKLFARSKMWKL
jgi:hypothetical protein